MCVSIKALRSPRFGVWLMRVSDGHASGCQGADACMIEGLDGLSHGGAVWGIGGALGSCKVWLVPASDGYSERRPASIPIRIARAERDNSNFSIMFAR